MTFEPMKRVLRVSIHISMLVFMQGPEVIMEGKRRIMLGSNNYLGLTCCPDVMEAGRQAIEKQAEDRRAMSCPYQKHLKLNVLRSDAQLI
ncbi:MAG: hypothetical protein MJ106_05805 [Lentisphaeria bacterium]|nr:hypothetical protein [Lentisphaeria bacterium]